jgi:hypothetical protein
MVETDDIWNNTTYDSLIAYDGRTDIARAFHRELNDLAREICHRIRKETKARSHKQVRHYPKKFEGNQRVDLMIALNQIYTVRTHSRRRYIDVDTVLKRIQSTRHFLPTLAKFFKSIAKDYRDFDAQLAALEGGLMLLSDPK